MLPGAASRAVCICCLCRWFLPGTRPAPAPRVRRAALHSTQPQQRSGNGAGLSSIASHPCLPPTCPDQHEQCHVQPQQRSAPGGGSAPGQLPVQQANCHCEDYEHAKQHCGRGGCRARSLAGSDAAAGWLELQRHRSVRQKQEQRGRQCCTLGCHTARAACIAPSNGYCRILQGVRGTGLGQAGCSRPPAMGMKRQVSSISMVVSSQSSSIS